MDNRDFVYGLVLAIIGAICVILGLAYNSEAPMIIGWFLSGVATGICYAKEFLTKKKGGK